jgi:ubiquinone/menaquinone biosynthesis C-methylase UbiE
MVSVLTALRNSLSFFVSSPLEKNIQANPTNVRSWLALIDDMEQKKRLSSHASTLVKAHELTISAHAANAFADDISIRGSDNFKLISTNPSKNIEQAIEEIVKWKTALQCGYSHDISSGYFIDAEPFMEWQWSTIILPLIKDLDFTKVVDLACGHGRNTEFLRKKSRSLTLVDINQSCIDVCRERFGTEKEGTHFSYFVTKGNNMDMIPDSSVSLVYSWDSMVHFDKLIVQDYVSDISRVLSPGGSAFLHHSNYGERCPDTDWAHNPGTRSDMSAELMRNFALQNGLEVVSQHIQGIKEGWGLDAIDCVSILKKPK